MGDPVESLRALRKRAPWASGPGPCPSCGHDSHAGRCFFKTTVQGRLIECQCKEGRESPNGDRVLDPAQPGRPGPGVSAVQDMADLSAGAEDVLARIREVGQTFTDGAARLEGAQRDA